MTAFDYSENKNSDLTRQQVQEDLVCLNILFQNKYVGQDAHPEIDLIGRLQKLNAEAQAMKSSQLLGLIFDLHQGLPDLHLAYQVNGVTRQYRGADGKQVELSENLDSEKVYDRGNYVYFKPAKILMPDLSIPQKDFIELIKQNDKNLVIDLTETKGGGGLFPDELSVHIFTSHQKIPKVTTSQIRSGLVYIGLSITGMIVYGEQGRETYNSVKEYVKNQKFSDLVPFTVEQQTKESVGLRPIEYKSKIFLLIDQDCASECETIVEKLSAHPNVVTIGANTRGALHYSNALSFVLPNSGIWVRIPSLRHIYENDAIEGIGFSPKIKSTFIDLSKLPF